MESHVTHGKIDPGNGTHIDFNMQYLWSALFDSLKSSLIKYNALELRISCVYKWYIYLTLYLFNP